MTAGGGAAPSGSENASVHRGDAFAPGVVRFLGFIMAESARSRATIRLEDTHNAHRAASRKPE